MSERRPSDMSAFEAASWTSSAALGSSRQITSTTFRKFLGCLSMSRHRAQAAAAKAVFDCLCRAATHSGSSSSPLSEPDVWLLLKLDVDSWTGSCGTKSSSAAGWGDGVGRRAGAGAGTGVLGPASSFEPGSSSSFPSMFARNMLSASLRWLVETQCRRLEASVGGSDCNEKHQQNEATFPAAAKQAEERSCTASREDKDSWNPREADNRRCLHVCMA